MRPKFYLSAAFFALAIALILISVLTLPAANAQIDQGGFAETAQAGRANAQATREAAGENVRATTDAAAANARASAEAASTNVAGTAQAVSTNARGTAQAAATNVAGTAQAASTNVVSTVQTGATSVVSTVEAGATNIRGTVETNATSIVATVQAGATQVFLEYGDVQATAQSLATIAALPTEERQATVLAIIGEELPEELEQYLNDLFANADISVDPENGTVSVTTALSESTTNAAVDQALVAAGYSASAVAVDYIAEGIVVTVEGVTLDNGMSGRLVIFASVAAVNGQIDVTVISATINDMPVPDNIIAELNATFGEAYESILSGSANVPVDTTVTAAYTTDTDLIISFIAAVEGAQ